MRAASGGDPRGTRARGRLADVERPFARAPAAADRGGRLGPERQGRLPERLGRAPRRSMARRRGAFDAVRQARSRSSSSRGRICTAVAEVRRAPEAPRARLPADRGLERRRPAAVRVEMLRTVVRHDLRRPDPGPRELSHRGGRRRGRRPTASRSRRWPGRRQQLGAPGRRGASCSHGRWRRSSRSRARRTRRRSATPAAARPPPGDPDFPTEHPISPAPRAVAACQTLVGRAGSTLRRPTLLRHPPRLHLGTEQVRREESTMDDATIHERIEKLVNEEHELWQREAAGDRRRGDPASVSPR